MSNKIHTSLSLSTEAKQLLEKLMEKKGVNASILIEMLIREEAERKKIK